MKKEREGEDASSAFPKQSGIGRNVPRARTVDEMGHEAAAGPASNVAFGPHYLDSLQDVQSRDYEFLEEEDGDLDFFVNGVRHEERSGVAGVGAVHHHDDGNVADDGIGDNH